MSNYTMPRIKARLGVIEDGPEDAIGMFCFEVLVKIPGDDEDRLLGTWGPYPTEALANTKMNLIVKELCDHITRAIVGQDSQGYIDMKDNEYKRWDTTTLH